MPTAVIGALRVDLTLGTAGWQAKLKESIGDADRAASKFKAVGSDITSAGKMMTAGVTVPLIGIGAAALKTAADYETAMGKLRIATQATGAEMKSMSALALELGKSTVFSASEAAGAMEELAKNGVSVENILNGAAKAAVDLAAATGSELEPAAVAVSDAMNQFKLSAKDLPMLVNQITGAVNESKLDFKDFQQGMAAAGGVAGAVGVSFADFNAVLAGTSSMFASGSDAGTSLKTFLTTLTPKSKAAAAAMAEYGLEFYTAEGRMKSMSDIAQMLQDKLGGLSDKTKTDVMSTIFGTDAMRTAVGLMKLGGDGLDNIAAKIAKTDAAAQSAERMKGLNAQLEQLGGTLETVAIKIGDTGLLTTVTAVFGALTDMLDKLTELSPAVAQFAVGAVAVVAALGPLMLIFGPLVSGIGAAIGLFAGWAGAVGAASVAAGGLAPLLIPLVPVLAAVAGAVAAVVAVWNNWDTIGPALGGWASGVVERVTEAGEWLAKIPAWIEEINGGPKINGPFINPAVVSEAGATFDELSKRSGGFLSTLATEWTTTWNTIDQRMRELQKWADDVDASAARIWKSFEAMHAKAQAAFNGMVDGIKSAVTGGLRTTLDWVEQKAKAVGDAFYTLYDRVVGHSYVPDLVDGIEAEMRRLDGVMVQPTDRATKKVGDAYKQLRDDLRPLMNELFPDQRAAIEQANKLALIARAAKAGPANGGLSAEQAAEASRRVRIGVDTVAANDNRGNPFAGALDEGKIALDEFGLKLPDLSKVTKQTTAEMVESFAGMSRDVLGSLRGMVASFKGGDILGGLSGLLDIVTQVAGLIGGNRAARQAVTLTGGGTPYGGGRAMGGPVVPGKRYRVGERGPEWLEVDRPGRITPSNGNGGSGGGNTYHFSGNMMTPEFWAQIQAGDDTAAARGASGGAELSMARQQQNQSRYLG